MWVSIDIAVQCCKIRKVLRMIHQHQHPCQYVVGTLVGIACIQSRLVAWAHGCVHVHTGHWCWHRALVVAGHSWTHLAWPSKICEGLCHCSVQANVELFDHVLVHSACCWALSTLQGELVIGTPTTSCRACQLNSCGCIRKTQQCQSSGITPRTHQDASQRFESLWESLEVVYPL